MVHKETIQNTGLECSFLYMTCIDNANQPSSLCFSTFGLWLTGVNFTLSDVALRGEQGLLESPTDLLILIILAGETLSSLELSITAATGTDTSIVLLEFSG